MASAGGNGVREITQLLAAVRAGQTEARAELFEHVYNDLKRLARRQVASHHDPSTPSATTVVHELYFRLEQPGALSQVDRAHFFAVAARAMRQILIDLARGRNAQKRGGGRLVSVVAEDLAAAQRGPELLAIDEALVELERLDSRLATVVEWRFFGGLTLEQIGSALGMTERTIKRDWRKARAFLYASLRERGIGVELADAP